MKIKYPRTHHLSWSKGATFDDKTLKDDSCFMGKEVVVTEKLDGENSTLAQDYYHARSLDSRDHASRSWIKNYHTTFQRDIPEGWRVCGENMFAKHSIHYTDLESYFYVFSIWNEDNICLSWDETVEYCKLLNLCHVPVLWRGLYDHNVLDNIKIDEISQEGYVIRSAMQFPFDEFNTNVAKYVREKHVQTNQHWMHQTITKNELKK